MENVNITATTKTDSGLEYNDPDVKYSPGDTFDINEVWGVWIDNEIVDRYVDYIKVESVSIEYVVKESEWYVNYEVGYYAYEKQITTVSLDNEDIDEVS